MAGKVTPSGLFYCRSEHGNYTSKDVRLVEALMKSNRVGTARSAGFSSLAALWSVPLRAAAIAVLLLAASPLGPSAAHAASAVPGVHVYLVRGVLNIFSLGLDEIAAKLEQQGITATVHNHLAWASIADDAATEYKTGRAKTIILVGHSSGATSLPDIVARMDQQGVPVKLAIGLDSVFHTSLAGRVGRYVNFYIANGAGKPVEKTKHFRGSLENVDVEEVPGVSHIFIDKNQIIQLKVIAAIDAVVFNSGSRVSAAVRPKPETAAVTPAARTGAAAAN